MRRILACIFLGGFLIAALLPRQALAQGHPATQQQQEAAEFVQLYESWLELLFSERKIAIGERLLAMESKLKDWPLQEARGRVKGDLWFDARHRLCRPRPR